MNGRCSRRDFLGTCAATGVVTALDFRNVLADAGTGCLRLGVLSDIHVSTPACVAHDEYEKSTLGTLAPFERALTAFRDRGVDAVVIAGDLTEFGLVEELRAVADVWNRVFPDDRGRDGAKVEKLFILGNHDAVAWRWKSTWTGEEWEGEERRAKWQASIARDPAAAWRSCLGETYAPIQEKIVKGVRVILAHWPVLPENERNWHQDADVPGLADWFAAHADCYSDGRPFFYVQHAHPKSTCFFASVAADGGTATRVLSAYPNAIALTGHAHQPLTDGRNVWQGAFTSIGTASLIDAGGRSWRENGAPYAKGVSGLAKMPYLRTGECRQGQYMLLEPGRLDIERLDFQWGLPVGPDWSVRLPADGTVRFGGENPNREVPRFAADAQVVCRETEEGLLKVSFPAATSGGRVYDYEVRVVLEADDHERVVASRRVLAPDYHLPLARCGRPGEVWFARQELPAKSQLRIEVYPIDCWNAFGDRIAAAVAT